MKNVNLNNVDDQIEIDRVPLTFGLAEPLPKSNSASGATARDSGGTTGGGPASEDANVDYD
ncbi:MAG: hypothetical protein COX77_01895 [Candidatus Komeilibacteria bacterium CG_4_10_14_0_2_um_filter_37_10]|uniref:Uncharacterized protein n=1 Tax=Candidatus Komeilibacteria bacterium CG_4_10_14_0_2_um_filter_37_10 TaxID=1974470 RepID=A0A2M7VFE5_9BACT|nr:MAG: hypothetical protein COX77_01895 [Candidatus Komeilibacteria bacterium CG_4_10_14_0_2_um_filter_37_10]